MKTDRLSEKKWIVKDLSGKIFGPLTTEQVLGEIERNYFLGSEQIASYPGGSWQTLSASADFSGRLLDVLDAEVKTSDEAANTRGKSEVKASQAHGAGSPARDVTHSQMKSQASGTKKTMGGITVPHPPATLETASGAVIELTDLRKADRTEQMKRSKLPLMIIALGLALGGAAILMSGNGTAGDDRIHLLVPRSKQPEISLVKRKEKFDRARIDFQYDTFAGYQKAENELVELIEGTQKASLDNTGEAEALSLLCMTYRELWPFAKQDNKDLKAVSLVTQEAKRVDPGGLHGSLCELVGLVLNGHITDAQGLADSVLRDRGMVAPVLIEMRGDLFAQSKDYVNAIGYFGQARSIWPAWMKTYVEEARAHADQADYSKAIDLYMKVTTTVPDHGVAKIEMGLIEALQFSQYDKGLALITSGVEARVPRPIEARAYLGLAQIYMKRQQLPRALNAAKRAYRLDPTSKDAKELLSALGGDGKVKAGEVDLMFLGEQYMRTGDYFSAQAQFKAAFDANPKNGIAAMKAGICLWLLNQPQDAIDWLRKAIRADPTLTTAYVDLADYYAQRYDFFAAVEILRRAQSAQPVSYELYRGYATVELRRNNFSGAINYGKKALKLYETDIDTLLLMGKASIGLQQFQEAQKYIARVIDLDYNNFEAHSLYGKIEAGLHGVESGASYIQNMLNRYVISQGQQIPQAAIDLRLTLGEIYMQDERYKPAEETYRQALALDPNSRKALVGLGKVLQAEAKSSLALEEFLKAAVLDPSDAEPIFLSGKLYNDIGKPNEAIKQFERVIKINPRYPLAHTEMGRVALRRGEAKKAIEEGMLERATNPDLPDSYLLAAESYFVLHQYSNCASEYQKAIARHAGNATTLVRMARCYRLTGAIDSAQSLLRQALSQESGNPDYWKEQGAIYHMRGMADEAITAYDTYLKLAPNAPDRQEVEGRIRKVQAGDLTPGE